MNISVEHIEKSFKKHKVLSDVNLTMEEGQIYCLLGASGSGKTTLLRIIMGALSADTGQVKMDQIRMPNKNMLSRIGFMPQQDALYQELSIWDNLRFFAGIQKLKGERFRERAKAVVEVVDLVGEEKKLISECSGGMKKRVSLAAALLHDPEVLILDEPTVGIDPILRKQIWNYLICLKERNVTIVVTTHVMDEVYRCDQAALLRDGTIIQSDSVKRLLEKTKTGNIEELFMLEEASIC